MALITMRDVTIAFEGVAAIEHVNLSIERGDYLVIVGENGSGKSTLMRAILGLVRPHSGQVLYGDGLRRSQIGYLPQQTAAQRDFPALCATDSILLLDEPVTGLDPEATDELYSVLRRLNREHGVTIAMVSHDLRGAMRDANKVLVMNHGVDFCGSVEEYRAMSAERRDG